MAKKRKMGDSGYDIKLELEEEEEKEAGEVGGDLDLLFRIKQEMDE